MKGFLYPVSEVLSQHKNENINFTVKNEAYALFLISQAFPRVDITTWN